MRIDKRILAGLAVLMPLVFWVFLREGYELPKWFLWRWGMVFIFLFAKHARNDNLSVPVFVFPWLAFFFFSLLSLGGAINLQSGLLNIANLVLGFSLFFLIAGRWEIFEIKTLIPFLILPALPVAVYGIFQAFGYDFVHLAGPFRGAISTFGHRNFVAEYELMMLPLLLYGGFFYTAPLTSPLPAGERNYKIRLVRGFSLASLPVVYAHFIMTHTRGSYAALIVALLCMAGVWMGLPRQQRDCFAKNARNDNRGRWFIGTVIALALLTGFFFARNYNLAGEKVIGGRSEILRQNTPQNDMREIPSALRSRLLIWQATLGAFRSRPVVGVGAGNLNEVVPRFYSEELLKTFKGKLEPGTSHNEYLQILAETGILGGFSFLTFLVLLLSFAGKVSRRSAKEKADFLPFFLTASVLGCLTASLLSSPLQRPATLFLFWLFTGFLAVFGREKKGPFVLSRKTEEGMLTGFAVILVLCAYGFGWRPIAADFYGQKSFTAYRSGNRRQAVLNIEKAMAFQPQSRELLTVAGNTYLGIGRFEEAIRYYERVTVYHPYWPQGYGNLGLSLAQAGFFAEAERYLNYSLRLDAYQPLVHNTLGAVYLQQGRQTEARKEFLEAINIDPSPIFPRLNLQEMKQKNQIK